VPSKNNLTPEQRIAQGRAAFEAFRLSTLPPPPRAPLAPPLPSFQRCPPRYGVHYPPPPVARKPKSPKYRKGGYMPTLPLPSRGANADFIAWVSKHHPVRVHRMRKDARWLRKMAVKRGANPDTIMRSLS
jgi:hypothetical protein